MSAQILNVVAVEKDVVELRERGQARSNKGLVALWFGV